MLVAKIGAKKFLKDDPVVDIYGLVVTLFSPTALGVPWVSRISRSPKSSSIALVHYLDGWPPDRGLYASTRWAGGHFSETLFISVKWSTVSAQVFRSFPAPCTNAIQSCVVSRLRTQSRRRWAVVGVKKFFFTSL